MIICLLDIQRTNHLGLLLPSLLFKHSFAMSNTSKINLLPTKAFYDSKINLPKTVLSLLANTFAKSLYTFPTKLIRLKSLIFLMPGFLGIRAIWCIQRFFKPDIFLEFSKEAITSFSTTLQYCWKNAIVKFLIWRHVELITVSFLVTDRVWE